MSLVVHFFWNTVYQQLLCALNVLLALLGETVAEPTNNVLFWSRGSWFLFQRVYGYIIEWKKIILKNFKMF